MRKLQIIGFLAIALAGLSGFTMAAYTPRADTREPEHLRWKQNEITISVSESYFESGLDRRAKREFMAVLRKSFSSWSKAANINFRFVTVQNDTVSDNDSAGDGISLLTMAPTTRNLMMFGEGRANVPAITRLFFDSKGFITEADIVLNPTSPFTTDGSRGSFDLQATLTHEAGHLIGLGHSKIIGATMHRHQGKNGVFGLPADYARTLSEDDAANARNLYGPLPYNAKTYGSLNGELLPAFGKQEFTGAEVWLENVIDGSVAAGSVVEKNGSFRFSSIAAGQYDVFVRDRMGGVLTPVGEVVSVFGQEVSFIEIQVAASSSHGRVNAFGFNGQISPLPITVPRGKNHTIYLGGESLDPERIWIESSSPLVSVDRNSVSKHYERSGNVVLAFEISVPEEVNEGEYSFRVYEDGWIIGIEPGVLNIVSDPKASN